MNEQEAVNFLIKVLHRLCLKGLWKTTVTWTAIFPAKIHRGFLPNIGKNRYRLRQITRFLIVVCQEEFRVSGYALKCL